MSDAGRQGKQRRLWPVLLAVTLITCRSGSPDVSLTSIGIIPNESGLIGGCRIADLDVGLAGADGAGGHRIQLIGFSNRGPEPCDLADPLEAEPISTGEVPVRRHSFFPVVPFTEPLAPGQTAMIGVETERCDLAEHIGLAAVTGVIFHFKNGVRVTVPIDLDGTCGISWEGFRVWE